MSTERPVCIDQQKSKAQIKMTTRGSQSDELQGVPDWLKGFKDGLVDESVPSHRDTFQFFS